MSFAFLRLGTKYNGDLRVSTDERIEGYIVNLELRHFFSRGWSAGLRMPVRAIEHDPGGGKDSEWLTGPGDLGVSVRYDLGTLWDAGGYLPSLSLDLGFGMPTGVQGATFDRDSDVLDERDDTLITQLPLGAGAFSVRGSLLLTQFLHPRVGLTVSVGGSKPLHPDSAGLQQAPSFDYGFGLLALPGGSVVLGAGARGTLAGKSDGPHGELVNSGGHTLAVSANVGVLVADGWFLGLGGRVPVYADVNGLQLTETFSMNLIAAWTFGGDDDEDERAHRGRSGDVRHSARRGKSFDLQAIAVPGKVTVIDFWATWCEPCKEITARLEDLAAEHPGLAVRKVEVPAADTPVAEEHMGGQTHLPQVWFLDRSGKKVAQIHGNHPDEIVETVLDLLGDSD